MNAGGRVAQRVVGLEGVGLEHLQHPLRRGPGRVPASSVHAWPSCGGRSREKRSHQSTTVHRSSRLSSGRTRPSLMQLRAAVEVEVRDAPRRQPPEVAGRVARAVTAVLRADHLARPPQQVREAVVGLEEVQLQVGHDREQLGFLSRSRQAVVDHLIAGGLQETVDPPELLLGDRPLAHAAPAPGRISRARHEVLAEVGLDALGRRGVLRR